MGRDEPGDKQGVPRVQLLLGSHIFSRAQVYIGNLTADVSEGTIREMCGRCGPLVRVDVKVGKKSARVLPAALLVPHAHARGRSTRRGEPRMRLWYAACRAACACVRACLCVCVCVRAACGCVCVCVVLPALSLTGSAPPPPHRRRRTAAVCDAGV